MRAVDVIFIGQWDKFIKNSVKEYVASKNSYKATAGFDNYQKCLNCGDMWKLKRHNIKFVIYTKGKYSLPIRLSYYPNHKVTQTTSLFPNYYSWLIQNVVQKSAPLKQFNWFNYSWVQPHSYNCSRSLLKTHLFQFLEKSCGSEENTFAKTGT